MDNIRVFLVEDDPDWLRGLQDFLDQQEGLGVVGTASAKDAALRRLSELDIEVDVILLDIMLSANGRDGLDIAAEISGVLTAPIIMLTSLSEEEIIVEAFMSGAVNYVNKSNFKDIPEAIRSAHARRSSIHPSAAEAVLAELNRIKREERQKLLTPSEKSILKLIQEGNTQPQVAAKVHIAERTIKNHISNILKKLGVKSSKEAAEIARKKGML